MMLVKALRYVITIGRLNGAGNQGHKGVRVRARDHALAPFVWLAVTLLFYIIVFGPLFEYAYRLQY